ncbi:hypothetical protein QAD02_001420 [Eretmocerus hayati]|uniref:Uncharacterized protein n=1 Tax=Eretmocerus hayati TaxID=131215 RepID=A0ACC2NGF0_9HYME|nr:hypothetical protein QAD02_001420 [Eretmocerus hayati]
MMDAPDEYFFVDTGKSAGKCRAPKTIAPAQYPYDWFQAAPNRGHKPKLEVPMFSVELPTLAKYVRSGIDKSKLPVQTVIAFLYKFFKDEKMKLTEAWTSYDPDDPPPAYENFAHAVPSVLGQQYPVMETTVSEPVELHALLEERQDEWFGGGGETVDNYESEPPAVHLIPTMTGVRLTEETTPESTPMRQFVEKIGKNATFLAKCLDKYRMADLMKSEANNFSASVIESFECRFAADHKDLCYDLSYWLASAIFKDENNNTDILENFKRAAKNYYEQLQRDASAEENKKIFKTKGVSLRVMSTCPVVPDDPPPAYENFAHAVPSVLGQQYPVMETTVSEPVELHALLEERQDEWFGGGGETVDNYESEPPAVHLIPTMTGVRLTEETTPESTPMRQFVEKIGKNATFLAKCLDKYRMADLMKSEANNFSASVIESFECRFAADHKDLCYDLSYWLASAIFKDENNNTDILENSKRAAKNYYEQLQQDASAEENKKIFKTKGVSLRVMSTCPVVPDDPPPAYENFAHAVPSVLGQQYPVMETTVSEPVELHALLEERQDEWFGGGGETVDNYESEPPAVHLIPTMTGVRLTEETTPESTPMRQFVEKIGKNATFLAKCLDKYRMADLMKSEANNFSASVIESFECRFAADHKDLCYDLSYWLASAIFKDENNNTDILENFKRAAKNYYEQLQRDASAEENKKIFKTKGVSLRVMSTCPVVPDDPPPAYENFAHAVPSVLGQQYPVMETTVSEPVELHALLEERQDEWFGGGGETVDNYESEPPAVHLIPTMTGVRLTEETTPESTPMRQFVEKIGKNATFLAKCLDKYRMADLMKSEANNFSASVIESFECRFAADHKDLCYDLSYWLASAIFKDENNNTDILENFKRAAKNYYEQLQRDASAEENKKIFKTKGVSLRVMSTCPVVPDDPPPAYENFAHAVPSVLGQQYPVMETTVSEPVELHALLEERQDEWFGGGGETVDNYESEPPAVHLIPTMTGVRLTEETTPESTPMRQFVEKIGKNATFLAKCLDKYRMADLMKSEANNFSASVIESFECRFAADHKDLCYDLSYWLASAIFKDENNNTDILENFKRAAKNYYEQLQRDASAEENKKIFKTKGVSLRVMSTCPVVPDDPPPAYENFAHAVPSVLGQQYPVMETTVSEPVELHALLEERQDEWFGGGGETVDNYESEPPAVHLIPTMTGVRLTEETTPESTPMRQFVEKIGKNATFLAKCLDKYRMADLMKSEANNFSASVIESFECRFAADHKDLCYDLSYWLASAIFKDENNNTDILENFKRAAKNYYEQLQRDASAEENKKIFKTKGVSLRVMSTCPVVPDDPPPAYENFAHAVPSVLGQQYPVMETTVSEPVELHALLEERQDEWFGGGGETVDNYESEPPAVHLIPTMTGVRLTEETTPESTPMRQFVEKIGKNATFLAKCLDKYRMADLMKSEANNFSASVIESFECRFAADHKDLCYDLSYWLASAIFKDENNNTDILENFKRAAKNYYEQLQRDASAEENKKIFKTKGVSLRVMSTCPVVPDDPPPAYENFAHAVPSVLGQQYPVMETTVSEPVELHALLEERQDEWFGGGGETVDNYESEPPAVHLIPTMTGVRLTEETTPESTPMRQFVEKIGKNATFLAKCLDKYRMADLMKSEANNFSASVIESFECRFAADHKDLCYDLSYWLASAIFKDENNNTDILENFKRAAKNYYEQLQRDASAEENKKIFKTKGVSLRVMSTCPVVPDDPPPAYENFAHAVPSVLGQQYPVMETTVSEPVELHALLEERQDEWFGGGGETVDNYESEPPAVHLIPTMTGVRLTEETTPESTPMRQFVEKIGKNATFLAKCLDKYRMADLMKSEANNFSASVIESFECRFAADHKDLCYDLSYWLASAIFKDENNNTDILENFKRAAKNYYEQLQRDASAEENKKIFKTKGVSLRVMSTCPVVPDDPPPAYENFAHAVPSVLGQQYPVMETTVSEPVELHALLEERQDEWFGGGGETVDNYESEPPAVHLIPTMTGVRLTEETTPESTPMRQFVEKIGKNATFLAKCLDKYRMADLMKSEANNFSASVIESFECRFAADHKDLCYDLSYWLASAIFKDENNNTDILENFKRAAKNYYEQLQRDASAEENKKIFKTKGVSLRVMSTCPVVPDDPPPAYENFAHAVPSVLGQQYPVMETTVSEPVELHALLEERQDEWFGGGGETVDNYESEPPAVHLIPTMTGVRLTEETTPESTPMRQFVEKIGKNATFLAKCLDKYRMADLMKSEANNFSASVIESFECRFAADHKDLCYDLSYWLASAIFKDENNNTDILENFKRAAKNYYEQLQRDASAEENKKIFKTKGVSLRVMSTCPVVPDDPPPAYENFAHAVPSVLGQQYPVMETTVSEPVELHALLEERQDEWFGGGGETVDNYESEPPAVHLIPTMTGVRLTEETTPESTPMRQFVEKIGKNATFLAKCLDKYRMADLMKSEANNFSASVIESFECRFAADHKDLCYDLSYWLASAIFKDENNNTDILENFKRAAKNYYEQLQRDASAEENKKIFKTKGVSLRVMSTCPVVPDDPPPAYENFAHAVPSVLGQQYPVMETTVSEPVELHALLEERQDEWFGGGGETVDNYESEPPAVHLIPTMTGVRLTEETTPESTPMRQFVEKIGKNATFLAKCLDKYRMADLMKSEANNFSASVIESFECRFAADHKDLCYDLSYWLASAIFKDENNNTDILENFKRAAKNYYEQLQRDASAEENKKIFKTKGVSLRVMSTCPVVPDDPPPAYENFAHAVPSVLGQQYPVMETTVSEPVELHALLEERQDEWFGGGGETVDNYESEPPAVHLIPTMTGVRLTEETTPESTPMRQFVEKIGKNATFLAKCLDKYRMADLMKSEANNFSASVIESFECRFAADHKDLCYDLSYWLASAIFKDENNNTDILENFKRAAKNYYEQLQRDASAEENKKIFKTKGVSLRVMSTCPVVPDDPPPAYENFAHAVPSVLGQQYPVMETTVSEPVELHALLEERQDEWFGGGGETVDNYESEPPAVHLIPTMTGVRLTEETTPESTPMRQFVEKIGKNATFLAKCLDKYRMADLMKSEANNFSASVIESFECRFAADHKDLCYDLSYWLASAIFKDENNNTDILENFKRAAKNYYEQLQRDASAEENKKIFKTKGVSLRVMSTCPVVPDDPPPAYENFAHAVPSVLGQQYPVMETTVSEPVELHALLEERQDEWFGGGGETVDNYESEPPAVHLIPTMTGVRLTEETTPESTPMRQFVEKIGKNATFLAKCLDKYRMADLMKSEANNFSASVIESFECRFAADHKDLCYDLSYWLASAIFKDENNNTDILENFKRAAKNYYEQLQRDASAEENKKIFKTKGVSLRVMSTCPVVPDDPPPAYENFAHAVPSVLGQQYPVMETTVSEPVELHALLEERQDEWFGGGGETVDNYESEPPAVHLIPTMTGVRLTEETTPESTPMRQFVEKIGKNATFLAKCLDKYRMADLMKSEANNFSASVIESFECRFAADHKDLCYDLSYWLASAIFKDENNNTDILENFKRAAKNYYEQLQRDASAEENKKIFKTKGVSLRVIESTMGYIAKYAKKTLLRLSKSAFDLKKFVDSYRLPRIWKNELEMIFEFDKIKRGATIEAASTEESGDDSDLEDVPSRPVTPDIRFIRHGRSVLRNAR